MLSQAEVREIRKEFPILTTKVGDKPLVYLDNAATTQKPRQVIEAEANYYLTANANPHRGAHKLANMATELYENCRRQVAKFLHAYRVNEIVFTKGATESLNLLAYTLAPRLEPGDEILISILEHHANLIPWQYIARERGAKLRYLYLDEKLELDWSDYLAKLNEQTKIVSLTACSNVTGTRPDLSKYFAKAKEFGAVCITDSTQLIPHAPFDVRELGADFAVCSSHKIYGPMGTGVLWGRYELLESMPPYHYGGDMIESVDEQSACFARPASRFEAGTVNVGGVVGLGAALDFVSEIGLENIDEYERHLTELALEAVAQIKGCQLFSVAGTSPAYLRGAVVPFSYEGIHPHDVATVLNEQGVAVRAGHHCAEPLHRHLGVNSTCRASFSFYNTEEEVERFIEALTAVPKLMGLR
ncbi:MAG: SufS family cysteine desulfurase [Eubacteriales bacterium]|nr:SufS family cysteine desulfurase [Eubacteriales bacterium]